MSDQIPTCPHYFDEDPEKRIHVKHFVQDNENMTIVECEMYFKCCEKCSLYTQARLKSHYLDFLGRDDIDILECPEGHILLQHDQFMVSAAVDIMFEGKTNVESEESRDRRRS